MNSFEQWLQNVEAEAKAELQKLGEEAKKVEEAIVPIAEDFFSTVLSGLENIVVTAIFNEAPKLISKQEKFSLAAINVYQTALGQGKALLFQDAQMAVQAGYRKLQSMFGQTGG